MNATDVWAWAEADAEIVGDAAELAEALGGRVAAVAAGADPPALAAAGAERVLLLGEPYDAEAHVAAIASAPGWPPRALLLPGTANGADLAPRLAVRLGAACLLDCAWLRAGPSGSILAGRWAHDDRVVERWELAAACAIVATLRPGSRGPARPRPRPLEVVRLAAPPRPRARRLRHLPADPRTVRLAVADRIVAAGLGIGGPELLEDVEELADLLGASLGASRPLADRGWVPFERQIGTTGQRVAPHLYLAIGISGASQHLAGIADAETIVAVNTDPACPMMARAALAVVGDAGEVVRALNHALRDQEVSGR